MDDIDHRKLKQLKLHAHQHFQRNHEGVEGRWAESCHVRAGRRLGCVLVRRWPVLLRLLSSISGRFSALLIHGVLSSSAALRLLSLAGKRALQFFQHFSGLVGVSGGRQALVDLQMSTAVNDSARHSAHKGQLQHLHHPNANPPRRFQ